MNPFWNSKRRLTTPASSVRFVREAPLSPVWIQSFGPYPWFVIPFLGDVVSRNGWSVSEVHGNLAPHLRRLIPAPWLKSDKWGQWHNLSYPQFKAAVSGEMVRLDKALTSAVLLDSVVNGILDEELIRPALGEVAFDGHVDYHAIIPSTFLVDGLERYIKDEEFLEDLSDACGQSVHLLRELSRGGAVVEYIAHDVAKAARRLQVKGIEPRLLKDRKDIIRHRPMRPIPYQKLERDRIAQFYDVSLVYEDEDDE